MYLIFFVFYLFLSTSTSFGFTSNDGFEYLFGTAIVTLMTSLIDSFIYVISYKTVGSMYSNGVISGIDAGRNAHWIIRVFLWIAIFLISLTPLSDLLLSPIIHNAYLFIGEQFQIWCQNIIDSFTESMMPIV